MDLSWVLVMVVFQISSGLASEVLDLLFFLFLSLPLCLSLFELLLVCMKM